MPSADSPRIQVLVVEDEPATLRFMALFLKRDGFEVLTATSVQEAVECAKNNAFNVILTDLLLLDGTGPEVVCKVREHFGRPIPAILVTGFSSDRLSAEDNKLFAACITKPIEDLDKLSEIVRSVALSARAATLPS